MPSFIHGALLFASAHADETALIQDVKTLKVAPSGRVHGLESLLESAKGFLRNGATTDVVEFVDTTLEEVSGVTIPAIENASWIQQRMVYDMHDQFQVDKNILAENNRRINQYNLEATSAHNTHATCRDREGSADHLRPDNTGVCNGPCGLPDNSEEQRCHDKRDCEIDLWKYWDEWRICSEEFDRKHDQLADHFCVGNGTVHSWRLTSVDYMNQYDTWRGSCKSLEDQYYTKRTECIGKHNDLHDRWEECNIYQNELEEKECIFAATIRETRSAYEAAYPIALSAYLDYKEIVRREEADRHREYVTLRVVQCLLDRIHELDGVPCDTAQGVDDEVGHCEERHGLDVCSENPILCIDIPDPPPPPPNCLSRHEIEHDTTKYAFSPSIASCTWLPHRLANRELGHVCEPIVYAGGECLPEVPPVPCSQQWNTIFIEPLSLFFWPSPEPNPYSETNPACNRLTCRTPCTEMYVESPGWTIDGCERSNAEAGEHPLTYHSDPDHLADVRCCSYDGETCQSTGFEGGVEFIQGNHHSRGCYFDVTHDEAVAVCAAAGKRLCHTTEVETCCNTGCYHNHHAIWVFPEGETTGWGDSSSGRVWDDQLRYTIQPIAEGED